MKGSLVFVLFLSLLVFPFLLEEKITFDFSGEVVRVVDGDTIEVRVLESRDWPAVGRVEKLRLFGVDAFELFEARGVLAKALMDSLCPPGRRVYCRLRPGRARDSYGRILATIYLKKEGGWINLGEELMDRKLARRWEG